MRFEKIIKYLKDNYSNIVLFVIIDIIINLFIDYKYVKKILNLTNEKICIQYYILLVWLTHT